MATRRDGRCGAGAMERSTEGEAHFGKNNLIPDGAFSRESKYYLRPK